MKHFLTLLAAGLAAGPAAAWAQASPPTPAAVAAPPVQELTVTGQKAQVQKLIDRKVYTVTQDLQATAGSAADVLDKVPSVTVDADGNVSLRGDSNVTVLIDGKPSAQFSGATRGLSLQQFPASDIDRIEVLTNPPAQYKAENSGGVINIITKKTRRAGLSGGGQLMLGDQRRYVFAANGAYNAGPLKLSGAVGLRQDAKVRLTTDSRTALDPDTGDLVASREAIDEHFRRLTPSAKADASYELNDRQTLEATASHRELTGVRFFNQSDLSGPPGAVPDDSTTRHSDGREWSLDEGESVRFDQKLWRPDETLSLFLQRSATRERERYAYRDTDLLPPAGPSFSDLHLRLDLVKTEFSADYDLPLSGDRDLKLGYDLEDDRNNFDNSGDTLDPVSGQRLVDPSVTNHFRYHQRVDAGYGQYHTPLGPWSLQAGVRLEATHVDFQQITQDIPGGRDAFAAYPSLSLDRALGDAGKLSASLSRRVTRPDPEALNPFSDHQDIHNLRAGDPNLLPQDTWAYELGYNNIGRLLTYGLTGYYRFDRDSVTDVSRPISADVVLVTKANLPKSRSAGLEFTANGKLSRKLSYALSGNLFYSQIDAVPLGATGLKSTTGVNLKASLDWRPTALDTAQIAFSRQDRRLTPQGSIGPIDLVNLGYKRQLRPDLSLVVTLSDAFDGQRFNRLVATPALRDDYQRYQIGRIAYAGLVYTFGTQKKAKPSGFEYDQ